jgi:hypothetical protein
MNELGPQGLPLPTLEEAATNLRHSLLRFGMTLTEAARSMGEIRHLSLVPPGDAPAVVAAPAAEYRRGTAIYDERGVCIRPALAFETAVNYGGGNAVPVLRDDDAV